MCVLKGLYFKNEPALRKLLKLPPDNFFDLSLLEIAVHNRRWIIAKWLVETFGVENDNLRESIEGSVRLELMERDGMPFAQHCFHRLGKQQFPADPPKLMDSAMSHARYPLATWLLEEFGAKCSVKIDHLCTAVQHGNMAFLNLCHRKAPGQCDFYDQNLLRAIFLHGDIVSISWLLETIEPKDWKKTVAICSSL